MSPCDRWPERPHRLLGKTERTTYPDRELPRGRPGVELSGQVTHPLNSGKGTCEGTEVSNEDQIRFAWKEVVKTGRKQELKDCNSL